MSLAIPLRNDAPHQKLEIELDGETFGLELRWNARAAGWFLSLYDGSGTLLVASIRLVVDYPLLFRSLDSRLPAGIFWVEDTSGALADPLEGDLGARVQLLYIPHAELGEALA